MLRKNQSQNRNQINMVCIEDLVPKNHILRGIDAAIDFSFIYDEVESLYSENTGRPSVDPVVLFKIVLVQYLFGIRSMRQTIKEIEVNMAYRWFCGFDMLDKIPNFTTFGKNYSRRFVDSNIFEIIFEKILQEAITAGFVDAKAAFIDSTHVKASANN
ncbi:MAG: transposase, partial [Oscillospiraceae bacterium]